MLYGRDEERRAIDRLLNRTRDGRGGALVLRGDPGLGKTALLASAAGQASGLRLLRVRGIKAEAQLSFAGLYVVSQGGADGQGWTDPRARSGPVSVRFRGALAGGRGRARGSEPSRCGASRPRPGRPARASASLLRATTVPPGISRFIRTVPLLSFWFRGCRPRPTVRIGEIADIRRGDDQDHLPHNRSTTLWPERRRCGPADS